MASPRSNKPTMLANIFHSILYHLQEGDEAKARQLIIEAVGVSAYEGYRAALRDDPQDKNYMIAFYDLPTGQVSFRVRHEVTPWDGMDVDKPSINNARLVQFLDSFTPYPCDVYLDDTKRDGRRIHFPPFVSDDGEL